MHVREARGLVFRVSRALDVRNSGPTVSVFRVIEGQGRRRPTQGFTVPGIPY